MAQFKILRCTVPPTSSYQPSGNQTWRWKISHFHTSSYVICRWLPHSSSVFRVWIPHLPGLRQFHHGDVDAGSDQLLGRGRCCQRTPWGEKSLRTIVGWGSWFHPFSMIEHFEHSSSRQMSRSMRGMGILLIVDCSDAYTTIAGTTLIIYQHASTSCLLASCTLCGFNTSGANRIWLARKVHTSKELSAAWYFSTICCAFDV